MEPTLFKTSIVPEISRELISDLLVADAENGAQIAVEWMFGERTKKSVVKQSTEAYPGTDLGPEWRGTTCAGTHYCNHGEFDRSRISHLTKEMGARLKCEAGWIGTFVNEQAATSGLRNPHHTTFTMINQNVCLASQANICFYEEGLSAMMVRPLADDHAPLKDLTAAKASGDIWSFLHFVWPNSAKKHLNKQRLQINKRIKPTLQKIAGRVQRPRHINLSGNPKKISMTPEIKTFTTSLGFSHNKKLSQNNCIVMNKTTPGGNVVRLLAQAGGFNWTEPSISVEFLGYGYSFRIDELLPMIPVKDKSALQDLLEENRDLFQILEQDIQPWRFGEIYQLNIANYCSRMN